MQDWTKASHMARIVANAFMMAGWSKGVKLRGWNKKVEEEVEDLDQFQERPNSESVR